MPVQARLPLDSPLISLPPVSSAWCAKDSTDQSSFGCTGRRSFAQAPPVSSICTSIHSTSRLIAAPPASVSSSVPRSEDHTSELQSLIRISYAFFCLLKNTLLIYT